MNRSAAHSDAPSHRRVLDLTWPVLLANLTIPMVGTVDTAVMGRLPDPAYIGAVAVGATIFSALYWLFGFLRMGTTGLIAQAFGSGAATELGPIAQRALATALAIAAVLLLAMVPIEALSLALMSSSEGVRALAEGYFSIRIWGAPAALAYLAGLGVLFGLQQMRATLYLSLGFNLTNLLLDLFFVLGLGWDVRGVAAGTVISETLAATAAWWLVARALRAEGASLAPQPGTWARSKLGALLSLNGDLIIRSFFVQAPFFSYTAIGARLGDLTLAANAILMQFFFVMIYAMDAFAHTAETLCGAAYGAGNRPALIAAATRSSQWAFAIAALSAVLLGLAQDPLIALLTSNADVAAEAARFLPWLLLLPLVAVGAFQLDGIFIGMTLALTMRNAMAVSFALYALCLWLALDVLGNHGLWLALVVFMGARGVLLGVALQNKLRDWQGYTCGGGGGHGRG
ncbi:MAG: MATE family efflux transporter, partial [Pseudomonadota bacterium]